MRMDRTILTCKEFVRNTAEMGPPFVEPVTDTIEMIFDEMVSHVLHRTLGNFWEYGCGRNVKGNLHYEATEQADILY